MGRAARGTRIIQSHLSPARICAAYKAAPAVSPHRPRRLRPAGGAEALGPASLPPRLKETSRDATLAQCGLATWVTAPEVRFCPSTWSSLRDVEAQEHSGLTNASDFPTSGLSAQRGRGSPPGLVPRGRGGGR